MSGEMKVTPRGRMFSVQYQLPRLPVPPLQQTMDKYLRSVRPLVTEEEFANTQQIVKEFLKSPGPELQRILEKRAEEKTNWLSEWWKNVAYLDYRIPVVVNFNPAVVFPEQSYRGSKEQLRFAAKFVAGALDYKMMVDEQTLPVEMLGGKPLCMMQYYQILAACRVPGHKKDTHVIYPSNEPDPPKHIAVIHNNHIFSVDVYGNKGKPLNTHQLQKQLEIVADQSKHESPPIGMLTTLDRDTWASTYADLIKDKKNKAAMKEIQRSIFVLCLDKPLGDGNSPPQRALVAAEMLHGGGARLNSGNRWYDKTLQFIVGGNGACGLNYEHTTAEGPPIAAIMDHVLDFTQKNAEDTLPAADVATPRRLDFNLTPKATSCIALAEQEMTSLVKDVQITVFTFSDYGKDFIKHSRLSPDAYIQVALQLTYYRLFKRPCATYETASLRRFQLGRTDTIRSCSVDTHEFTQGMENRSLPDAAKVALLRQAVKAHRKYTDEAVSGQGVDRHLLGLKLAAIESGQNIPQLFLDDAFTESTYFRLSTSQVGAKHDAVMAFGPSAPDGFGCCYNPQNTRLNFAITAFNICAETDSDRFANVLKSSLTDLHDLLAAAPQDSKL
ncbi:carnitine O-acetyltransferase-like isoform X2 [Littorina saxatilis]